jgi:hypothetical protein
MPLVPEVVVCPLPAHVHCTVSPGWIVTGSGEKQKHWLGSTDTVTVAALAIAAQKARVAAIVGMAAAMRSEEIVLLNWMF